MVLTFLSTFSSCSDPKIHQFGDKIVTKKKCDRKMNRNTQKFVKNMTKDEIEIFSNLQVTYDTTKIP